MRCTVCDQTMDESAIALGLTLFQRRVCSACFQTGTVECAGIGCTRRINRQYAETRNGRCRACVNAQAPREVDDCNASRASNGGRVAFSRRMRRDGRLDGRCVAASPHGFLSYAQRAPSLLPLADGRPGTRPVLGFEIEAIAKRDALRIATIDVHRRTLADSVHPLAIVKYDGSLGDYGAEICTIPASLSYWHANWPTVAMRVARASAWQAWSESRAGMHVHINRAAFTMPHLARFAYFWNASTTDRLVLKMAMRRENSYCRRVPSWDRYDCANDDSQIAGDALYDTDSRYVRANLTDRTMEIRIFRSSITAKPSLRALESVHAAWKWTQHAEGGNARIGSPSQFLQFLDANGNEYPNLHAHLR